MAPKTISLEDQLAAVTADNDQKAAQIDALNQQLKQASGFQTEAVASRETIQSMQAAVNGAEETIAGLRNQVGELRAQVESAQNQTGGDAAIVRAAQDLSAALKVLAKI